MAFLDNMLEINNNFLLIGLIVVAITCIYLLYSNLTRVNDSVSLKSTINNLIQQNKKRDEIINFLLERIENLEHGLPQLPTPETVTTTSPILNNSNGNASPTNDLDDILNNIDHSQTGTNPAVPSSLLNSISDELFVQPTLHSNPTLNDCELETSMTNNNSNKLSEPNASSVTENIAETKHEEGMKPLDDFESEFGGMFDNIVPAIDLHGDCIENVLEVGVDGTKSEMSNIDIVSVVLEADDIGNMADYEINMTDVPRSKDKLNAKYTVKQLKQIAQKLNLNTKGNKTDLVDRIYNHLTTPAEELSEHA